jgi:hypothetical protein
MQPENIISLTFFNNVLRAGQKTETHPNPKKPAKNI